MLIVKAYMVVCISVFKPQIYMNFFSKSREPELKVKLFNEDGELVHLPLVSKGLAELD